MPAGQATSQFHTSAAVSEVADLTRGVFFITINKYWNLAIKFVMTMAGKGLDKLCDDVLVLVSRGAHVARYSAG